MAQAISTSITRRTAVAGLALTAAPMAVLAAADNVDAQAKQTMPEKSLYERLGGVFAIAAVVDHFSDAVVKNPLVGQTSKNPQLREWHTNDLSRLPASSSCERCGCATFRVGPSSIRPPSPARLRLVLRKPIGTSAFLPQNSMRSQQNSDGPWTSPRCRSARRPKSWQLSPPTRMRSPLATSQSTAETSLVVLGRIPARRLQNTEAGTIVG